MNESKAILNIPAGTQLPVWIRAASLAGCKISELLKETAPVKAAHYNEAKRQLDQEDAAASETTAQIAELQLNAERSFTQALRAMADDDEVEAMHLGIRALRSLSNSIQKQKQDQTRETV